MHEKNLAPSTNSLVKSLSEPSFRSKLKLQFFLLFLSCQLCTFYYIKNYSQGCVGDCKYCYPSREWTAEVSELLLPRVGTFYVNAALRGLFPAQTLKAVQPCLGWKVPAFITLLVSGRRHQQHSCTTFCSWGNLSMGPLVCFTESQGRDSSPRLSNNWATLNSRLHHWDKQTLPASTALATVPPTSFAEQHFPSDSICGGKVSL